jgi:hypothetical protein
MTPLQKALRHIRNLRDKLDTAAEIIDHYDPEDEYGIPEEKAQYPRDYRFGQHEIDAASAFLSRTQDDRTTVVYRAPRKNINAEPTAFLVMDVEGKPNKQITRHRLKRAVAHWVIETEAGAEAYQYAGNDLNIGDLLGGGAFQDPSFQSALAQQGIYNASAVSPEELMSYDHPLAFYVSEMATDEWWEENA